MRDCSAASVCVIAVLFQVEEHVWDADTDQSVRVRAPPTPRNTQGLQDEVNNTHISPARNGIYRHLLYVPAAPRF